MLIFALSQLKSDKQSGKGFTNDQVMGLLNMANKIR